MEDLKKAILVHNGRAVGAIGDKNFSTLPIGCIAPYLGRTDNIPRGYLFADGSSYKTTDYPELFNVIRYTYGGSGDTFNVPNLSDGRFLEGSIISGGYVNAGLPNIEGEWGWQKNTGVVTHDNTLSGAFTRSGNLQNYGMANAVQSGTENLKFDASKSNPIYGNADTVQPKSLMVLYIIKAFHTNEGVDSGVSDDVVEYVEGEVATKQENIYKKHITSRKGDASDTKPYCLIATLKTSNLTFVNEPIIIEGVMGNATSSTQKMLFKASFDFRNGAKETAKVIYGYINQSSLFSHIDLLATFDESAEIAYIYVHHKTNYSIIDADISVPQRNAELYLTIPETFEKTDTIIGTEAHRMSTSTNVKVLAGLDDTTSSTESTWSSSKIASEINPAIDISKVFLNGTLNIATLYTTYGAGRYVAVGQGTTGNGTVTIDIWTLVGGAISYMVNALYSPKTSVMFVGYTYENPTIDFDANYFTHCNHIAKVCTLA